MIKREVKRLLKSFSLVYKNTYKLLLQNSLWNLLSSANLKQFSK